MLPPEVQAIPDTRDRFLKEREQLGPMSRGERNVLFVLILMLVLWTVPTLAETEFLDIWYVPPVAMVLLFVLPVEAKRGEMTLGAGDFHEGVGWNVLFLVLGGMALAEVLTSLGVIGWLASMLTGNLTARELPWIAGPGHAFVNPAGQRSGDLDHGVDDPLPDCGRSRLQPRNSRPDHRGHGPGAGVSMVESRPGHDVRVRRRRVRDDGQGRARRNRPDIARGDRAEHDPGTGAACLRQLGNLRAAQSGCRVEAGRPGLWRCWFPARMVTGQLLNASTARHRQPEVVVAPTPPAIDECIGRDH